MLLKRYIALSHILSTGDSCPLSENDHINAVWQQRERREAKRNQRRISHYKGKK